MNKAVILGRLTKEPELRFSGEIAVCKFTLAVNREFKKDETDFINCVAFGKRAETISQYVTKGQQLCVHGSIRTGSYDAQDGTKRYTTDINVDSFTFISGNNNQGNSEPQGQTQNNNPTPPMDDITPLDDGDMPFN